MTEQEARELAAKLANAEAAENAIVCANCGDDFPEIDCATELCEMCFEHIMGPDAKGFEP